jgi:hypothetical protein
VYSHRKIQGFASLPSKLQNYNLNDDLHQPLKTITYPIKSQSVRPELNCPSMTPSWFLGGPLLELTEARWKVGEEPVNADIVEPIVVLGVRVLGM